MILESIFDIARYVFIIWFTTELRHCINYETLFIGTYIENGTEVHPG